jgi:phage tail sheath protein FI
MGARTLKQDGTANRYVSMRRSLIYLKKELQGLTQFALFENNDADLWARLRTSIGVFLTGYLNQGGLAGAGPTEAFFVKCDRENNSTDTVANGEVHIEVGVALEYPAEFVVLTLSQKTAA